MPSAADADVVLALVHPDILHNSSEFTFCAGARETPSTRPLFGSADCRQRSYGSSRDSYGQKASTDYYIFSDIKDFSILADQLDPGTLAVVPNDYLSEMAEIAFSFGGTVDKFIGDSVVVIFGAPLDTEPALQANQCVQMALAMHHRTKTLNVEWIEKGLLRSGLLSRMGIHTGEATVGGSIQVKGFSQPIEVLPD